MASQPHREPQPEPEVAAALRAMLLESDNLRAAAKDAFAEALECTSNDVAGLAGFLKWARPLRRLGDVYASKGFKRERPKNFEMLVSPGRRFALTLAPGDRNTGTTEMPSTRIERGPLTGQAVVGNRHQLGFEEIGTAAAKEFDPTQLVLWLLLVHHDEQAEEIRVELSLPVEFTRTPNSERGFVTAFEPRLVLPVIPLKDDPAVDRGDDQGEDDGQIDVPVSRR